VSFCIHPWSVVALTSWGQSLQGQRPTQHLRPRPRPLWPSITKQWINVPLSSMLPHLMQSIQIGYIYCCTSGRRAIYKTESHHSLWTCDVIGIKPMWLNTHSTKSLMSKATAKDWIFDPGPRTWHLKPKTKDEDTCSWPRGKATASNNSETVNTLWFQILISPVI